MRLRKSYYGKGNIMTTDTKLLLNILEILQVSLWATAFGVILVEIVDMDETKSFKRMLFAIIPWLLICAILICVFERISNLIAGG